MPVYLLLQTSKVNYKKAAQIKKFFCIRHLHLKHKKILRYIHFLMQIFRLKAIIQQRSITMYYREKFYEEFELAKLI